MIVFNTENKRISEDKNGAGYVSIISENTENKRIDLVYSDSETPLEGLYLKDDGEGVYGIYSIYGGEVPELIPEGTEIRGVVKGEDGEYYIDESEVSK